jgi:hypothetical protein
MALAGLSRKLIRWLFHPPEHLKLLTDSVNLSLDAVPAADSNRAPCLWAPQTMGFHVHLGALRTTEFSRPLTI